MRIASLCLRNFGVFSNLELPLWTDENALDQRVTVLIGENGSGKSTVMEAATTLLSWLTARIRSDNGAGSPIDELNIRNGCAGASLTMTLADATKEFEWTLARPSKGHRRTQESQLTGTTRLAEHYRQRLNDDGEASLPLIAYYPTERYVLDIPKKIRTKHQFQQVDGYDASLTKGIDFRRFFEWFRNREDIRNENKTGLSEILPYLDAGKLLELSDSDGKLHWERLPEALDIARLRQEDPSLLTRMLEYLKFEDPQYTAVLRAIAAFMPGYGNLRIQRRPRMRMLVNKHKEELDILQLSQGERSLLALVGDIARRLAMMNPQEANPLNGKGVVLIDEVDLHLHPSWQRTIIRRLRETFPHCQFILTTHSPLVISDPDNIQVYLLKDGTACKLGNLYGMDIEQVLLGIMNTDIRDPALQEKLDNLLKAIQRRDYAGADTLRQALLQELPPDHRELTRAELYLRRQRALDAKNH